MKRIFTLLALCLISALGANAQVTFRPGVRAGVNFANITQADFDSRTDFYIGGYGAIKFSRFYIMQPEVTYSRQGAKGETVFFDNFNNTLVNVNSDIEIQYLSFALINKFTFSNEFNVHVGPMLDFETRSNVNTNAEFDLGIMAGVGYTLPMGLTIEARVKKGIVDVLETDDYNDYTSYNVNNYNTNFLFQVGLSYTFNKLTGATD
jgi:hypothetical protein